MYARMATYGFTGDAHDLASRAEAGILPILQAQPGFQAYSVAVGDGQVLSLSVWDTRADAEAGSAAVASWVADNMSNELDLHRDSLCRADVQHDARDHHQGNRHRLTHRRTAGRPRARRAPPGSSRRRRGDGRA